VTIEQRQAPLLTVAMPIYNAGVHLRHAVLSLLGQTFANWELLVIDDGSTDNAVAGIADLVDARIRVLSDGSNRGLAARLNEAIDLAQGDYFVRMDQDDVCHPERFDRQLAFLEENKDVDLVGARCVTLSETGELLGSLPWSPQSGSLSERPWLGIDVPHPTWFGRLNWFRRHRYASPSPYCCEDQELLLRTHESSRFFIVPEFLLAYRLRDRMVLAKTWRTRKTLFGVQLKYFLDHRQYLYLLLATGVFAGRLLKDLLQLLGVNPRIRNTRSLSDLGAEECAFWRVWIRDLAAK